MHRTARDKILGKCFLFLIYNVCVVLIVLLFTLHPIYKVDAKYGERNTTAWVDACLNNYDKNALDALGLS